MLVRARKLKDNISFFLEDEKSIEDLSTEEWKQVDYLIEILYPFCLWTNAIGAITSGPTIHHAFAVYNKLFDHLDAQIEKLKRKRLPWKVKLRDALKRGQAKLTTYYSQTKNELGDIYGIGTILAPEHKLAFFDNDEWRNDEGTDWVS